MTTFWLVAGGVYLVQFAFVFVSTLRRLDFNAAADNDGAAGMPLLAAALAFAACWIVWLPLRWNLEYTETK